MNTEAELLSNPVPTLDMANEEYLNNINKYDEENRYAS